MTAKLGDQCAITKTIIIISTIMTTMITMTIITIVLSIIISIIIITMAITWCGRQGPGLTEGQVEGFRIGRTWWLAVDSFK